jgi:hypothetical protein
MSDHTVAILNGILITTVLVQIVLTKIWTSDPGDSLILANNIPSIAFTLAGLSGALGLLETILDFLAKLRARDALARKNVAANPQIQELIKRGIRPGEEEIEKLSKTISTALENELSDSDRHRVEEGLHQKRKDREWRYITMLF